MIDAGMEVQVGRKIGEDETSSVRRRVGALIGYDMEDRCEEISGRGFRHDEM